MNEFTSEDLVEFSKWINNKMYNHRLYLIPNDLVEFYLKNRENIIQDNKKYI